MDVIRTTVTSVSQAPTRLVVSAVLGLGLVISVTGIDSHFVAWLANIPAANTVIAYSRYLDSMLAMMTVSNFGASISQHRRSMFLFTLLLVVFYAYIIHVQGIDPNNSDIGNGVKTIIYFSRWWVDMYIRTRMYFSDQFQRFSPQIKSMLYSLGLLLPVALDLRFVVQVQLGITAVIMILFWVKRKWAFWSIVGLQSTLTVLILVYEVQDAGWKGFVNVIVSVALSMAVYYVIDCCVGGNYSVFIKVLLRSAWNGVYAMEAGKNSMDCVKIVVYSSLYFGCQFYILDNKHVKKLDDEAEQEGQRTLRQQYAY